MQFNEFKGEGPDSDEDPSLREEAAEWMIKQDRVLTPEEERLLAERLLEEPRLEEALERSRFAWSLLDSMPEDLARGPSFIEKATTYFRQPPVAGITAVAALLVLTLIIMGTGRLGFFQEAPLDSPGDALNSPTTRLLSDGSLVRINSGSVIDVQYSENARRIALRSGEAHFTVIKDPERPFIVSVDRVQVQAVGTAFNVQAKRDAIDVIVTEGTVQISGDTQKSPQDTSTRENYFDRQDSISMQGFVSSGQRALIRLQRNKRQIRMEMDIVGAKTSEVEASLAWQRPLLTLGGDTLGNIAGNFEEKTGLRLEIADPRLNDLRIGGRFPSEDPKGFLQILKLNYGIDWQEKEDGALIIGSRSDRPAIN